MIINTLRYSAKKVPGSRGLYNFILSMKYKIARTLYFVVLNTVNSKKMKEIYFDSLDSGRAITNHRQENYVVNTKDKVIGKLLYSRGFFDFQKFERAMEILTTERPTSQRYQLIDIGAHIGPICIPAVCRNYVESAMAFEPDIENFQLLKVNIALNNLQDRIKCYNIGIADKRGYGSVIKNHENHGDNRISIQKNDDKSKVEDFVTIDSMDNIIDKLDENHYIVWIDVQGLEYSVLSGSNNLIDRKNPIIIEFTPSDLINNGTLDKLIDKITGMNYNSFYNLEEENPSKIEINKKNIEILSEKLQSKETFTDILLI